MNNHLVLYKKSARQLSFTVPDVPSPATLSLGKAYWMLKRSLSDSDASALVSLTITTTATSAGQITDNGAGDGSGRLEFVVSNTALDNVTDLSTNYYACAKVILSNGNAYLLPESVMPVRVGDAGIEAVS